MAEQNKNDPDKDKKEFPNQPVVEEMEDSYLDYAMSVIVSRALPDVRDGLKPVQRRILYAMYKAGWTSGAQFKKCATIVGRTLGRYHPHGDIPVYDALVRMAQDFSYRYELIEGQGNFGSIDDDPAAAMRYTEARLRSLAEEMLADIKKDTVPWSSNFDNTREEPDVLPAKAPQLLLNGAMGIAVGMATSIPPHNLGEVVDALLALSEDPDLTTKDLLEYIKGPDFPTGGEIFNKENILSAYAQGKGPIVQRAKTKFAKDGKTPQIIVNELTFQTTKSRLIEKAAKKVKEDKLEGVKDIRDESDKDGIRIVIELKQGINPEVVLNRLYKKTNLQKKFHLNMVALKDGIQPRVFSLKELLEEFLSHRKEVIKKRTAYELDKAEARIHILEGFTSALNQIDAVINTIRKSEDKEKAHKNLRDKFDFSEKQTEEILKMRLQALAALEREKVESELEEKKELASELRSILEDPEKILEVLQDELKELKEKYGDKRRTEVHAHPIEEIEEASLIKNEEVFVTLTQEGYIKRLPTSSYKKQGRAGYGIIGQGTKEGDAVKHFFEMETEKRVLFFTNQGRVYQLKGYQIPEGSRRARGKPIVSLLPLKEKEKVISPLVIDDEKEEGHIALSTKNGKIKKTDLQKFENIQKTGIRAISLKDDDRLCWAQFTSGEDEFILITKQGQSIRFSESEVRAMGRSAQGVKGIELEEDDEVRAMDVIQEEKDKKLLVVSEKGIGKKTKLDNFSAQSRGGKGIKAAQTSKKTGPIAGAKIIQPDDEELLVASSQGKILRTALEEIPTQKRNTQGVKIMRLKEGDKVASFTIV